MPARTRPTPDHESSQRRTSCSSGALSGTSAARRRRPRASRLGLLTAIGLIEGHWLDPVVCRTGRATSGVCSGALLGSKGLCCVAVPRRLLLADDNIDGLHDTVLCHRRPSVGCLPRPRLVPPPNPR